MGRPHKEHYLIVVGMGGLDAGPTSFGFGDPVHHRPEQVHRDTDQLPLHLRAHAATGRLGQLRISAVEPPPGHPAIRELRRRHGVHHIAEHPRHLANQTLKVRSHQQPVTYITNFLQRTNQNSPLPRLLRHPHLHQETLRPNRRQRRLRRRPQGPLQGASWNQQHRLRLRRP